MSAARPRSQDSDVSSLHSDEAIQFTPFGHFLRAGSSEEGRRGTAFREVETSRTNTIHSIRASIRGRRKENTYHKVVSSTDTQRDGRIGEKSGTRMPGIVKYWWPELVAFVVVLGSFLGLVAVLTVRQDKPQNSWPNGITLNAVVSIFSVSMKAAMLLILAQGLSYLKWDWFKNDKPLQDMTRFDRASRGPLGSLWLLFTLRGWHFVATTGAIVTAIAIAIDPFTQQIVRYYSCVGISQSQQASIPRANMFEAKNSDIIDPSMQATIESGFFLPSLGSVSAECPGSSCDFQDVYHTVGYCSTCQDISGNISINMTVEHDVTTSWNVSNSTLPSGLSVVLAGSLTKNGTYFAVAPTPNGAEYEFLLGDRRSNEMNGVVDPTCSNSNANESWHCSHAGAASCKIEPCTRTYTAEFNKGVLQEQLVETSKEWGPATSDNYIGTVYLPCLSSSQRNQLQAAGYNLNKSNSWLAYNSSINPNATTNSSDIVPSQCLYQTSLLTHGQIKNFLHSYLSGSITTTPDNSFTGPPQIQALYNSSTTSFSLIDSLMTNVTNGMTAYMRQNGVTGFNQPATGTVFAADVCTRVEWAWITFPAALVLLTTVFLICVILKSSQVTDWKSSPLPLVFSEVSAGSIPHGSSLNTRADYERVARDMRVRLVPAAEVGSGGWRFVSGTQNQGME